MDVWSCPACTFENSSAAECCEVCETGRPGKWTCRSCTLLNDGTAACEACGKPRSANAPKAKAKAKAPKAKAAKRSEAWRPANHLLANKGYEAKQGSGPRPRSSWAAAKGDFVRGSCRLVLDASLARGPAAAVATLGGKELWDRVWRVDMPCEASEELPTCPICLGEPELIRTPQCGHVICLACALRHMQATKGAAKCAVCSKIVRLDDLRPVRLELQHLPNPENYDEGLSFTLVRRTGMHYLSLASDTLPQGCRPPLPLEGEPGARFARRIFGDAELYLSQLHADLRALESMAVDEEQAALLEPALVSLRKRLAAEPKGAEGLKEAPDTGSETLVFYQSSDGQLIFLEPHLMKQLLQNYSTWSRLPGSVTLRLKTMRQEALTPDLQKRHRFLAHLPSDAAGNLIAFADGEIMGPGECGDRGERGKGNRRGKGRRPRQTRAGSSFSGAEQSETPQSSPMLKPQEAEHVDRQDAWDEPEPADIAPTDDVPTDDAPTDDAPTDDLPRDAPADDAPTDAKPSEAGQG